MNVPSETKYYNITEFTKTAKKSLARSKSRRDQRVAAQTEITRKGIKKPILLNVPSETK